MENKEVLVSNEKAGIIPFEFNPEQVELIKKTVAKGCDNNELALFMYTCKRTGLDPLIKQIYAVKRGGASNQMSIQTGIDGYRLIAERSGKYAPGKEPLFKYDKDGKLFSATAYVSKLVNNEWHEVAATAIYSEYFTTTNQIWHKMPHAMLAKCAEALALRKAFPAEMAGVYTSEEMQQAGEPVHSTTPQRKSAIEAKIEPIEAKVEPVDEIPVEQVNVAKGKVTNHYPPKGKGPHSFKVGDFPDYLKTFDALIAETLIKHKENDTEIEVNYEWVTKGDFSNAMIKGITVQGE